MRYISGTSTEQLSSSESVQKLNVQARDAKNTKVLMDEFKIQLLQLSQLPDSNST